MLTCGTGKHPNINVKTQIPLELITCNINTIINDNTLIAILAIDKCKIDSHTQSHTSQHDFNTLIVIKCNK